MNITVEKDSDYKDVDIQSRHRSTDKFDVSREDDSASLQSIRVGRSDGRPKLSLESAGVDLLLNDHSNKKDSDQVSVRSDDHPSVHVDVQQQQGYDSDKSDGSRSRSHHHHSSSKDRDDRHGHDFDYNIRIGDSHRSNGHDDRPDHRSFFHQSGWNADADARSDHSYGHRERFSPEDVLRQKKEILHQFRRLQQKGVYIGKGSEFTMDTSLEEMKYEYERIRTERETDSAVKMYRGFLTATVNFCEFANKRYNPYKLNLDGWSSNVDENISDYDEVFEDLHAKYASSVRVPPEIKLIGMVVGAGIMTHFTNSIMSSSSMPNMDEIFKTNPDLRQQFKAAAVQTTAEKNAGLGDIFNMVNSLGGNLPTRQPQSPVQRREMKGPAGFDDLVPNEFKGRATPNYHQTPRQQSREHFPQNPGTPTQNPPSPKHIHDDDQQTIGLSEMNDDRLSEVSDFETSTKHIDILKRPASGPRANRNALLTKLRTKKRDGGLVVEI